MAYSGILLAKSSGWTMYPAVEQKISQNFSNWLFSWLFQNWIWSWSLKGERYVHASVCVCVCTCVHGCEGWGWGNVPQVNECGQRARSTSCGSPQKVPAIMEVPFTTAHTAIPEGSLLRWVEGVSCRTASCVFELLLRAVLSLADHVPMAMLTLYYITLPQSPLR